MVEDEKSVVVLQGVRISHIHIPKADTQKLQSGGNPICKRKCFFKNL